MLQINSNYQTVFEILQHDVFKLKEEVLISILTSLFKNFCICNTHINFLSIFVCIEKFERRQTVNKSKSIHDCVEEIFRCLIFYKTFLNISIHLIVCCLVSDIAF